MIDKRQARLRSDRSEERLDDVVRSGAGKRDPYHDDPGSAALGDKVDGVATGVVLVVADQDLVAGLEVQ